MDLHHPHLVLLVMLLYLTFTMICPYCMPNHLAPRGLCGAMSRYAQPSYQSLSVLAVVQDLGSCNGRGLDLVEHVYSHIMISLGMVTRSCLRHSRIAGMRPLSDLEHKR